MANIFVESTIDMKMADQLLWWLLSIRWRMVKKVSQGNAWSSVPMNCVLAMRQRRKQQNNGLMSGLHKEAKRLVHGNRHQVFMQHRIT
jgi:hypothetical protein